MNSVQFVSARPLDRRASELAYVGLWSAFEHVLEEVRTTRSRKGVSLCHKQLVTEGGYIGAPIVAHCIDLHIECVGSMIPLSLITVLAVSGIDVAGRMRGATRRSHWWRLLLVTYVAPVVIMTKTIIVTSHNFYSDGNPRPNSSSRAWTMVAGQHSLLIEMVHTTLLPLESAIQAFRSY